MIFSDAIKVAFGYQGDRDRVLFLHDCGDNHTAHLCLKHIWDWLAWHNADYTVHSFQVNQCVISIYDQEVRVLLKMSFAPADREYQDDPPF